LVTDKISNDWLYLNFKEEIINKTFNNIIIQPEITDDNERTMKCGYYYEFKTSFKNSNRYSAYDLSPYDETVLIDVDYIVQCDMLDMVWGTDEDYLINKNAINLRGEKFHEKNIRLNTAGIDMYWATLVYFKKNNNAKILFDTVQFIKENYTFYKFLYNFPGNTFRNDYAFSIALHILSGFMSSSIKHFPISTILTMDQTDDLVEVKLNEILFLTNDSNAPYINHLCKIKNMDVHLMNKISTQNMFDEIFETYQKGLI